MNAHIHAIITYAVIGYILLNVPMALAIKYAQHRYQRLAAMLCTLVGVALYISITLVALGFTH